MSTGKKLWFVSMLMSKRPRSNEMQRCFDTVRQGMVREKSNQVLVQAIQQKNGRISPTVFTYTSMYYYSSPNSEGMTGHISLKTAVWLGVITRSSCIHPKYH